VSAVETDTHCAVSVVLGTVVLKCQSAKMCGISAAVRLKEFHCTDATKL
jgi:hypothetical protein